MEFNKERFLLRLVAAVVISPLALYGIGAIACSVKYTISGSASEGACQTLQANLGRSTESALSVLLALLGGGALAVDAANQKRREEAGDQGPPAVEPTPTRPMPPRDDDPRF
jgi:hypothetical protein